MDHFFLIVIFFIFFILTNAQSGSDTSVTNTPWFWPLLSISLALLISILSTFIILVFIFYKKYKSNDDSDESSFNSNSSTSEEQSRHSDHIEGFRSPPPPYITCERPANLFMTSSPPPSYGSHINDYPSTIVNVPPPPPPPPTTTTATALDLSSTFTNPSIQTFLA